MALSQQEFETLKARLGSQKTSGLQTSPQSQTPSGGFDVMGALSGKTSFPASMGGAESIAPNIAKTFGNIPSSAMKMVAPVNPFAIDSPANIGANIAGSGSALYDIYKNRGVAQGTKDILGGFADTYLKIGESIYGGLDKAYNALLDDPKKAVADVTTHIAKIGIEDPMLIPTLLYGGGKLTGGKDAISRVGSPVPRGADTNLANIATKTVDVAKSGVSTTYKATTGAGGAILDATQKFAKPLVSKASDVVTPIEKGVRNVLVTSPDKAKIAAKLQAYTAQAEKALADYSQKTPLEMAGEQGQVALSKIQSEMRAVGAKKGALTEKLAGTPIGGEATKILSNFKNDIYSKFGGMITKDGIKQAPQRILKITDPADRKLVETTLSTFERVLKNPTFKNLDDMVDTIQGELYKRKGLTAVPVNSQVESALKGVIKNANDYLKKIGGKEYTQVNISYANRRQVFDLLNKALGQEGNKGASLMKQLFSPSGTASRKLFKAVKDMTGIDLVEEATLAKFVMENIGDVRQASLLEQVLKGQAGSQSSLIGVAAEKILGKIQDPIGKAKRIIQSRTNPKNIKPINPSAKTNARAGATAQSIKNKSKGIIK